MKRELIITGTEFGRLSAVLNEVATFSYSIGCVSQQLWNLQSFQTSETEFEKIKYDVHF